MKEINLTVNNLTRLTESDLIGLCDLNNIKPNELERLDLRGNKLFNIDFITSDTPFINLKILLLTGNKIKDLNNIQYLVNLKILNISYLDLNNEIETVKLLKNMKNLKSLLCYNTFKLYTKIQIEELFKLYNIEIII